jgi:plasmid stability protein
VGKRAACIQFPFKKLKANFCHLACPAITSIDFIAVNDYNDSNFSKEQSMAVLTVRNLDPDVKTRLRVQAAQQGIAMEEAVRRILTRAANEPPAAPASTLDLGQRIQARFSG